MIEDSHGESKLCKFPVVHDNIGLEAIVFGWTHTGEVDAVFGLPVVFLQVAEVVSHHCHICPPFLQTDQDTHADLMDTRLSHTIESIDTPFEFGLHASRVILFIVRLIISFLKADDSVQPVMGEFFVFFRFEGHHFNLKVTEIRFCQIESTGDVRYTCCCRIFTCHE